MARWYAGLDYDCEGDPPSVYIGNDKYGQVIEVLQDPTYKGAGEWSDDDADWTLPYLAHWMVDMLNTHEVAS